MCPLCFNVKKELVSEQINTGLTILAKICLYRTFFFSKLTRGLCDIFKQIIWIFRQY